MPDPFVVPLPIGVAPSRNVIVAPATAGTRTAVKMTFAKGASLADPSKLFNASLEGNTRRAIDVREDIIQASEKQMVEMILIIARKVIKDEIIERKEVVLNNIREALKRIKDRDRVDIRVNPDVPLYEDAVAGKATRNLLGEYFVSISPGTREKVRSAATETPVPVTM